MDLRFVDVLLVFKYHGNASSPPPPFVRACLVFFRHNYAIFFSFTEKATQVSRWHSCPLLVLLSLNTFGELIVYTCVIVLCGVHGPEVERRPCNHEVPSSIPRSGFQLRDCSLSTGVLAKEFADDKFIFD